ncbi:hypothetical protein V6N13_118333 [Hibiscus sabdariffa]
MEHKGLWHVFARHGDVMDMFITRKQSRGGKKFGFVRFERELEKIVRNSGKELGQANKMKVVEESVDGEEGQSLVYLFTVGTIRRCRDWQNSGGLLKPWAKMITKNIDNKISESVEIVAGNMSFMVRVEELGLSDQIVPTL